MCVSRYYTRAREDVAEVCGCLVVDKGKGACGTVGVKTNAVLGAIGRCAVEEVVNADRDRASS